MTDKSGIGFSLIVPFYNEQDNVKTLHQEIVTTLKGREYELIYVNDASTDKTYQEIKECMSRLDSSPYVKVINLPKNLGQSFAFKVGLDNARFEVVIFMDGDLQNDPRDIPHLLDKIKEGYDLVQGIRLNRKDAFLSRRLPSTVANFILRVVSGSKFHDIGCSLKAFKKRLVSDMVFQQGMHRMLPVYFTLKKAKVCELGVNHRRRRRGKTKYGFSRTLEVLFEIVKINFFERNSNTFLFFMLIFAFIIFSYGLIKSVINFSHMRLDTDIYFMLSVLGFYLFVLSAALYISRSFYIYYKDTSRLKDVTVETFN